MKNAMKKLMAFALVAVMLIGTLPFAANAAAAVPYQLEIDGQIVQTGTVQADDSKTLLGHLSDIYPAYAQYEFKVYLNHSVSYEPADIALATTVQHVKFQLTTIVPPEPPVEYVTVGLKLGTNQATFQIEKGDSVTLNEALLAANGLNLAYDHYLMQWSSNSQSVIANGTVVTPDGNIWYTAIQAPNVHDSDDEDQDDEGQDETPDNQQPESGKAYLDIYVNTTRVTGTVDSNHTTYGSVGETVSVAACIELAAATNVKSVALNGAPIAQDATFTLGVADSVTNITIVTEAASTNPGGTTGGTTTTPDPVAAAKAYIYVGNNDMPSFVYTPGTSFSVAKAVKAFDTEKTDYHYAFDYYILNGSTVKSEDDTDTIDAGEIAHIYVKVTESKLNHNKVYLQIFMNNDFDVPAKTINVTTMATENGLYREGNVRDLILESFSAKNSNGIKIDGMYPSTGSWVAKFLEDNKVKNVSNDEIVEMKEDDYVVFNIMVTNAKLKSSSTADSTNPKTADNIYAVVTIMTASAAALAVAFYLNKKRAF